MADKNPSTNHDLPRPAPGTFDGTWGTDVMNDDMTQKLEERLIARDLEANLSNYTPYDGAIFIATDTGAVYDGNGTDWKKAERDFDTVSAESVNAEQREITNLGFEAHFDPSGSESVPSSTFVTLTPAQVSDDTNNYDSSTGDYVTPFGGDYIFSTSINFDTDLDAGSRLIILANIGGGEYKLLDTEYGVAHNPEVSTSNMFKDISAGETINFEVFHSSSSSVDLLLGPAKTRIGVAHLG